MSLQFPGKIAKIDLRNLILVRSRSLGETNPEEATATALSPSHPLKFFRRPNTILHLLAHLCTCSTNENPNTKAQNISPLLVGIYYHFTYFRHTVFPPSPPKKKKKELYDAKRDPRCSRSARVAYLTLNHFLSLYYYSLIVIIN